MLHYDFWNWIFPDPRNLITSQLMTIESEEMTELLSIGFRCSKKSISVCWIFGLRPIGLHTIWTWFQIDLSLQMCSSLTVSTNAEQCKLHSGSIIVEISNCIILWSCYVVTPINSVQFFIEIIFSGRQHRKHKHNTKNNKVEDI